MFRNVSLRIFFKSEHNFKKDQIFIKCGLHFAIKILNFEKYLTITIFNIEFDILKKATSQNEIKDA